MWFALDWSLFETLGGKGKKSYVEFVQISCYSTLLRVNLNLSSTNIFNEDAERRGVLGVF